MESININLIQKSVMYVNYRGARHFWQGSVPLFQLDICWFQTDTGLHPPKMTEHWWTNLSKTARLLLLSKISFIKYK